jgi:hypothetical protein
VVSVAGLNVAANKSVYQISDYYDYYAFYANDGDLRTISCTNGDINPWWAVDLGSLLHVGEVRVVNDFNSNAGKSHSQC